MELLYPEAIDEYTKLHTSREDPLLRELTQETYANAKYPTMQTGHVEGSLLAMLVGISGAQTVLEIGTYTGYSALAMAAALPEDGQLITCDIDPAVTIIAQRYWARSPHGQKIDLRLAPALETIATLEGTFDFVFIDADKENYVNYWEACLPKVRSGGLIVADNVLWSGKVLDPKDLTDHAIVAFNQHVRYDERVRAVMLPVRDGVTLARRV